MAKKTKTSSRDNGNSDSPSPSVLAKSEKKKRRSTDKPKKASSSAKGTGKTKASAASSAPRHHPTDEEIRIRAYFISERRRRFGLAGDAHSDWAEARRQLLSEPGSQ